MSPRWALASYSCILGKFEISSEVEKTFNWNLLVTRSSSGDDDDHESNLKSQQVNVARIFKYPQVRIFMKLIYSCREKRHIILNSFPFISQTKFKHFLYSGDVVLLELETPLEFGETITAACLNSKPIDSDTDACISVGWFTENGMQFFYPHI